MKSRTPGQSDGRRSEVRRRTEADREVAPTANGCPTPVVSPARAEKRDEHLLALHRARARQAIDRIRCWAEEKGLDRLTMNEIDEIIADVRRQGRSRASQGK